MEKETIKGYKGFDKDLKCRGFQYEVGKEYSTEKAVACNTGFHYCENPMDVLGFYAPCDDTGKLNRFCEVEGSGDFDKSESDKICCTHLKVKAEIGLQGLIKAGVKFILDRVKWEDLSHQHWLPFLSHQHWRPFLSHQYGQLLRSHQHWLPFLSHQYGQLLLSHQYWLPFLSHQHWLPFLSHQYWLPFLSHQHWRLLLSHQHWRPFLSHQYGQLLRSHQYGQLLRSKR